MIFDGICVASVNECFKDIQWICKRFHEVLPPSLPVSRCHGYLKSISRLFIISACSQASLRLPGSDSVSLHYYARHFIHTHCLSKTITTPHIYAHVIIVTCFFCCHCRSSCLPTFCVFPCVCLQVCTCVCVCVQGCYCIPSFRRALRVSNQSRKTGNSAI